MRTAWGCGDVPDTVPPAGASEQTSQAGFGRQSAPALGWAADILRGLHLPASPTTSHTITVLEQQLEVSSMDQQCSHLPKGIPVPK